MGNEYNVQIPWPGWQIVRKLGGGGFGTVYEIERDLYGDKERAAMKVVRIPKEDSELQYDYDNGMNAAEIKEKYDYLLKHMTNEYQLMLQLKGHSNITNCHDFAVIPHPKHPGYTVYIRMELLTPLQEVMKKGVSEEQVIKVGIDICKALDICGQRNIIHRDIKPDNILMSEFGDYKLTDFGIARTMEKTMSASMSGTEWYMAPEVLKRMKYGRSVDTYSLGLVLYCMLNRNRLPFVPLTERITMNDMQKAHAMRIQGKPVPEPMTGSSKLKAIVLKALAYDREQRYRSAKEMLDDLQSIADQRHAARSAPKQQEPKQVQQQTPQPVQKKAVVQKGVQQQELTFEHKVFGIYMDNDIIHVRMYSSGKYREVLTMPAVYVYTELDEILIGNRAVLYQKCHRKKQPTSVLGKMTESLSLMQAELSTDEHQRCGALMKELKKQLDRITGGQVYECVITVGSSDLRIQKAVRKAMTDAGFRVLRSLNPASAYVLARSAGVKQERQFVAYVIINGRGQKVLAHSEEQMLEILENRIQSGAYNSQAGCAGMIDYVTWNIKEDEEFVADANRGLLPATTARFEELAAIAANGAVFEGLILIGHYRDYLLLDICPWKLGVEIVGQKQEVCLPLTWIIEAQTTIPVKRKTDLLQLRSDAPCKYLRLYAQTDDPKSPVSLIGEWSFDKPEVIGKEVEAGIDIEADGLYINVELKTNGNTIRAGFIPDSMKRWAGVQKNEVQTCTNVPKHLKTEVHNEAIRFVAGVNRLNFEQVDASLVKGVQMIAKQGSELTRFCNSAGEQLQTTVFVEKILEMADNLEYGIKGFEKYISGDSRGNQLRNCLDASCHLSAFYQKLNHILLKVGVTPVEAEGMYFDPYVHEAMMTESIPGVEENVVITQIQRGYFIGNKLFRPARVKVTK